MAPLQSLTSAALLLLLSSTATAHFTLETPLSFGFDESKEDTAPCGGFNPNFDDKDKVTDFHVGGDAISVKLGHTQSNWLFRGTLDGADTKNWTQLAPIVQQSGLGFYCQPSVAAPEEWAGKQGIVSIVANAPDGLLYQCAAVNFVSGKGTAGSECKNGTIQVSVVPDKDLSAMVNGGDDSGSGDGGSSASGTGSPESTPTTTGAGGESTNAAAALVPGSFVALALGLVTFGLL